jgi:hypothetical protein
VDLVAGARSSEMTAADELQLEAARSLAEALETAKVLHHPGARDRYRELLEHSIASATHALAAVVPDDFATLSSVRSTLAAAHAAKADDACHGAGQLSLSAQRAPTRDACEDGWRRVEAIVIGAEQSAAIAARMAAELEGDPRCAQKVVRAARKAASVADAAAERARRVIETQNQAYTFHTQARFSFGEGWYVAAAAVLDDVLVQVEPDEDGHRAAEHFLRSTGLADRLRPYRSRPRAMKHVTELVGRAFRDNPAVSQGKLRRAFLGQDPIPEAVTAWTDRKLAGAPEGPKVLFWIRDGVHHPARNTRVQELVALIDLARRAGLVPMLTGDALREGFIPKDVVDLILFWKDPLFRGIDRRKAQLWFFEHLRHAHGVVGQLGVTTAGMDGPALMGLPTLYLTDAPNVRMREWVGAVPGYTEVVRDEGYLERVMRELVAWGRVG